MKYTLKEGKCAQFSRVILKSGSQTSPLSVPSQVYFLFFTCKCFRTIDQRPSETIDEMILFLDHIVKTQHHLNWIVQILLIILWKRGKCMTFSKQAGMLQIDFSLQKKSKIPKSYNSHRTKLLSSDQLQLKERKKQNQISQKTPNQPTNPNQRKKNPTPKSLKPPKTTSFEDST